MHDASSSDIAFTDAVKSVQEQRHSRTMLAARGGFRTAITADLTGFLAEVDTAYLATASAAGQPYAQHRGGPKGFIRVVDEKTLAFADYKGNRQYITSGNLSENNRAFLFLMDYANRRRVKIWGHARAVSDPALAAQLMPEGYHARAEQVILFTVEAWDTNCSQHIPRKLDVGDVADSLRTLQAQLDVTLAENARLRAALAHDPA